MNKKNQYVIIAVLLFSNLFFIQASHGSGDKKLYGKLYPDEKAVIFFKDFISTEKGIEAGVSIDPETSDLYFRRFILGKGAVNYVCKNLNGILQKPVKVENRYLYSFNGKYRYFEKITAGKKHLSNDVTYDLWVSKKMGNKWGADVNFDRPAKVSSHWNPFFSDDGFIYYNAPNKNGKNNIYRAAFNGKTYSKAERIGNLNTDDAVYVEPVISPDGSYMIFYSAGRNDNFSEKMLGDIYVSFKDKRGNWSKAYNLGPEVNSKNEESFPSISPDGRLIFFSAPHIKTDWFPSIYWISSTIINKIKIKNKIQ